jgi:hypothetical protein
MTPAALIIMTLSVGSVLALTSFCIIRVWKLPAVERDEVKGQLAINTRDTLDAD